MAEAPENAAEESDVTEQEEVNSASLQQKEQAKEVPSHQNDHQPKTRATSSKKKKDRAGVKTSENEKSSVPMSNVKNLQELINKLSGIPGSLTAALSETDGASKTHEFWDTQPVPKLGIIHLC